MQHNEVIFEVNLYDCTMGNGHTGKNCTGVLQTYERVARKEISMHNLSVNLPPLLASTELISLQLG